MTALCSGKICTIFPEKGALNFWKACTIALEYSNFLYVMLISLIFLLGTATIAFADEETLAGDEVVPCTVTFSVTDVTYSYEGDIEVLMNDVTGTSNKSYTLTKANSYGSGNQPKFTIPAPTTYKITFKGMKEGYQIVNSDNTKITDFLATANGYEFNWKITYTDKQKQEVEKEVESIRGSIGRGSSDSTQTQDNNQNVSNTSTTQDSEKEESQKTNASKNQSADEAFQEFLDKVSFTENDETWNDFATGYLGLFNDEAQSRADDFVNVVKNATEEDWFNMSQYDRFVYYESYVRIQKYINLGNWEKYFSSKEAFHNKITSPVVELMNGTEKGDSTVVSDAYLKLMDWQYDYVQEHKAALDFITGKDYIESGGSKADLKQEQKDKEAKRKAEINELQEAKKAADISDDTSEKRGLVIIPLILVLGCGILLICQKFKHDK